ncbi:hypothetical protein [Kutzneria buriramensis]|uniref:Uncharacterized protein n=1 Tax=Kutzneria buriramensis TaxID=1045776 RepID=A0A3E0HAD8_9PSEU|nr:hypothetical protein [Kutzneria buriramensis]REH41007.1 hypothetical protein BCF44_11289 [Kutzneria buriramensis]
MALRTAAALAAAFTLLSAPVALASTTTATGQPTWDQLYAQQTLNREHTAKVFPKLDPNARDVDLSDFGNDRVSQFGGQSYLGGQVWFTDTNGGENVYLQVSGPTTVDALEKGCAKATRCSLVHEKNGSHTYVLEDDEQTPGGVATTRFAENLRADGTLVLAQDHNYLPQRDGGEPDGAIRGTFPLTVDQLLTLVRDKAYQI